MLVLSRQHGDPDRRFPRKNGREPDGKLACGACSRQRRLSTLAFELDGSGRLFYEARLRYAKKELPEDPLDRGFFVKKVMRSVRPEQLATAVMSVPTLSASSFAGGDLVLADLVVVTPSPREFVVIDDPLPAGLEPVDARLSTTAASLDVDNVGGRQPKTIRGPGRQVGDRLRVPARLASP